MRVETHHYTDGGLFEQSFDVYRPAAPDAAKKNDGGDGGGPARPVVALVVGSAWLGHRRLIYGGTSWWNSAGPRRVASLGYTCVCIRHRGAFPRDDSWAAWTVLAATAGLLAWLAGLLPDVDGWGYEGPDWRAGENRFAFIYVTLVLLVQAGGRGCASFDDMQGDVMDALDFMYTHRERLGLDFVARGERRAGKAGGDGGGRPRLVLGGYSSGGHVCATVVRRPDLWGDRLLPPPSDLAGAMLYVSPVLATRARGGKPAWFTDEVVRMVFGRRAAASVPSPLHEVLDGGDGHPDVPHVLVGCRNEVFGLTLMDTFFASEEYSDALDKLGIDSKYRSVESDHWSVLGSRALGDALGEELDALRSRMGEPGEEGGGRD